MDVHDYLDFESLECESPGFRPDRFTSKYVLAEFQDLNTNMQMPRIHPSTFATRMTIRAGAKHFATRMTFKSRRLVRTKANPAPNFESHGILLENRKVCRETLMNQ